MKVEVKLPYPYKIFGVTISIPKKIGFMFTNLAMFIFRENIGIKTSIDYKQWIDKHGELGLVSEILYASACAYSLNEKKKENFCKGKLLQAIDSSDIKVRNKLIEAWKTSTDFNLDKKKTIKTKMK